MEVPHNLKNNVRLVLLSKPRGIFLENLCEEFECLVNKPLHLQYQDLGYRSLEQFLRSIPDAARLDFSTKDQRMKVYGVLPPKNAGKPEVEPTVQVKQELIDDYMEFSGAQTSKSYDNLPNTDPSFDTKAGVGKSSSITPGSQTVVGTGTGVGTSKNSSPVSQTVLGTRTGVCTSKNSSPRDQTGFGTRNSVSTSNDTNPRSQTGLVTSSIRTGSDVIPRSPTVVATSIMNVSRSQSGAVSVTGRGAVPCGAGSGSMTGNNVNSGSRAGVNHGDSAPHTKPGFCRSSSVDARTGWDTSSGASIPPTMRGGSGMGSAGNKVYQSATTGANSCTRSRTGIGATGRSVNSAACVKDSLSSLDRAAQSTAGTSSVGNTCARSGVGVSSTVSSFAGVGGSTNTTAPNSRVGSGMANTNCAVNANTRCGTSTTTSVTTNTAAGTNIGGNAVTDRSSSVSAGGDMGSSGTADKLDNIPRIVPDHRGFYSLGFLAKKKPDVPGSLKEFFSLAGEVAEVHEPVGHQYHKFIFVRYFDAKSAIRAFQIFGYLGLKPSSPCLPPLGQKVCPAVVQKQEAKEQNKRTLSDAFSDSGEARPAKRIRNRGKRFKEEGPPYRVQIRNLDPAFTYTITTFFDLFRNYPLCWVKIKPVLNPESSHFSAFVLLPNRELAEKLVAEFHGFVWMGRALDLQVKDKQEDVLKKAQEVASGGLNITVESSLPDLVDPEDMPGLEPTLPELERGVPGLESALPPLEPSLPGLEPGMPGLEPGMRGLESGLPGLELGMPGLEPSMPGLEPGMPGLESSMPGLELVPNMDTKRRVEIVSSGEVPRICVNNFMDYVTENDLRKHFRSYGVKTVEILLSGSGRRKAFVQLDSLENVERAVSNQHNRIFKGGLKLKLDVEFDRFPTKDVTAGTAQSQNQTERQTQEREGLQIQAPIREEEIETLVQEARLTVHMQTEGQGQAEAQTQGQTQADMEMRTWAQAQAQARATGDGSLTVSDTLKMRSTCLQILQTPDITLQAKQQIKVLVTTVISDSFFWGQVVDQESMQQLEKITMNLNNPESQLETAVGPGRCMAIFEGDGQWYRAWAMPGKQEETNVRVFYLDYGNTALVPWYHTAKNHKPLVWSLRPMAIPFTLTVPVTNLKNKEMTQVTLEVKACGSLQEGNMVVVKAVSLIPDFKQYMASIGNTVIT